ncbi:MAG: anaerobic ribonucleoside-triphosphate reductase [bacterium]|nr:anaerobic ribonucleoside-triphosphate reductase [bacterium]
MEKVIGEGIGFERIRRVTGYLAGDVSRFNNGKRAEEKDRVKHCGVKEVCQTAKEVKVES